MVCLDSDILIDFLRNDKLIIKRIKELSSNENLSITSINSFEILKGFNNSRIKREEVIEFLSHFNILNFNFEASEWAAEIFNQLKSDGNIIELPDIMIGSIVIANNERLLTRNIQHFGRIKDLKLEKLI